MNGRALVDRGVGMLRRATPPAVVPLIVRVRLRRALRDPGMWDRARAEMRFLLGDDAPDDRVEHAARGYIEWWTWRAERRWRRRMVGYQRVVGIERLTAARDLGRGVVLNFMHHGQYEGAFTSLCRAGVRCTVIVHPNMMEKDAPEHLKQHYRVGRVLTDIEPTTIGSQGIADLVRRGAVVALATDAPGSSPLTFVGRRVAGSSGAARIAFETGAPVVLLTTRRDSSGQHLHLSEAIDPTVHESPDSLLDVMVRHHEEAVLAWPEAADSPRSRWRHLEADSVDPGDPTQSRA